jgi:hypothetical protein
MRHFCRTSIRRVDGASIITKIALVAAGLVPAFREMARMFG